MYTTDEILNTVQKIQDIQKEARDIKYYNTNSLSEIETICNILKALNIPWGEPLIIPRDFKVVQKYYLTNSKTKYQPQKDEWYVVWNNGNIGCLQFTTSDYWFSVQDEWEEFLNTLYSFDPLDYNERNCKIIYDTEMGKKVMEHYKDICKHTQDKINEKVKQKKIEKLQAEIEKLNS